MSKDQPSPDEVRARIDEYAKRLLAQGQGRAVALKPAARHAIEKALRWKAKERAAATMQGQEHLKRGRGYLSQDLCDEAISELSLAVVLLERDVEGIHHLALAHQRRWNLNKAPRDKNEALRLARWCLELDPDHKPSFSIVSQLTHPSSPGNAGASGDAAGSPGAKPSWLMGAVLLGGLGCMALLTATTTVAWLLTSAPNERPETPKPFRSTTHTLPVTTLFDEEHAHLRLEIRHSELVNYEDSSYYTLHALLHNERQGEQAAALREVEVKVTLFDEQDRRIDEGTEKFPQFEDLALRPGEAAAFRELIPTDSRPTRAELRITKLELGAYEEAPDEPRELVWTTPALKGIKLRLYERNSRQIKDLIDRKRRGGDRVYHRAAMKVVNDGPLPVKTLKLKAVYFDPQGRKTGEDVTYAVSGSDPPMQSGDARLFLFIESVPASTVAFETHVIEVN